MSDLSLIDNHPHIWRAGQRQASQLRLSTQHPALDEALSGGLIADGAVRIVSQTGIGELSMLTSVLAQFREHKLCVFINPPGILQPAWLASASIQSERVYQVAPTDNDAALWAAEQCLKSSACHCVLVWSHSISPKQARRLQVAASHNNALVVLYMPPRCRRVSLPVSQDLSLQPAQGGLSVNIIKQAQGWPVEDVFVSLAHVPDNQPITRAMALTGSADSKMTHAG
ncbi:translesion DNA synthesis-associated protein ImuA [Alteromonas halophila]|uniref:Recombinase RecA n=1 Tax=Alteromonas halophila TaxID=516698 RepID=A0A918JKJ8_9ALTE|nr:translesion DNA synthesis-associated protein ImuA [Alteromonas halophila]GGW85261.1 recombinase RecA [Alteromonas halophila]